MNALILHLQAPLMSFGGPQIDHIGPTGRVPTLSQIAGMLANALGYDHAEWRRTQELQDRLAIASALLREGRELEDYQTVYLGQSHLRDPGWTTRGASERRDGDGDSSAGTHIRHRRYRAESSVLTAAALDRAGEAPTLADLGAALERPARPLFLGRKPCLPAAPVLVGVVEDAADPEDALARAPSAFPDRWNEISRQGIEDDPECEIPVDDERALSESDRLRTGRVVDLRDWRSRLHGGERAVLRRRTALGNAAGEPS